MQLKKVNIIGMIYRNRFQKQDGTIVEVEISEEEYKNGKKRTLDGAVWIGAYGNYRYDTPSFNLEDGTYADNNANEFSVKIAGKQYTTFKKDKILNHILPDEEVNKLK